VTETGHKRAIEDPSVPAPLDKRVYLSVGQETFNPSSSRCPIPVKSDIVSEARWSATVPEDRASLKYPTRVGVGQLRSVVTWYVEPTPESEIYRRPMLTRSGCLVHCSQGLPEF
jgi:hypothetical protein